MIGEQYVKKTKKMISEFDPQNENRYFIFGSATRKERFGDIDIGVTGNAKTKKNLSLLREQFAESTFPYFVDIVDFDEAQKSFTEYVRQNEPLVWIN